MIRPQSYLHPLVVFLDMVLSVRDQKCAFTFYDSVPVKLHRKLAQAWPV